MKKLILTITLVVSSLSVFGQMSETKVIAVTSNGSRFEVISDLPAVMIPSNVILTIDGKIKTHDGFLIGMAMAADPNNGGSEYHHEFELKLFIDGYE